MQLQAFSQKSAVYHDPEADYKLAVDLFTKEKYSTAKELFDEVLESNAPLHYDVRSNSEYYAAMCAIKLEHKDADYRMETFIDGNGESTKIQSAYMEMGRFDYDRKKYKSSTEWFDKVNTYDLKDEELSEYYFKAGYSYFTLEDYKNARLRLTQITGIKNKYQGPALYYTAHMDYAEGNYETALNGFKKLQNDENFAPIVPYYISQLYFLQERYDEVIAYAQPMLETASEKRKDEIAKLIGESYYRTKQYKEAVPYLKMYEETSYRMMPDDYYTLAYAQYQAGMYEDAIPSFERAVREEDKMAQLAYYYIADCFLKTGNKQAARNSFRQASQLDFDEQVQEDALFNYAKLAYELSFNPYNEAIIAFEEYIRKHPNSERIDEAYQFLLSVYLTTSNYKSALASIENMKSQDEKVKSTYQRVAYFRAIELFNDLNFEGAIMHFDKSQTQPKDLTMVALCYYWKGEACFKLEKYKAAVVEYNKYLYSPGIVNDARYNTVNYNIGYSYFKQASKERTQSSKRENYKKAIVAFRKFASAKVAEPQMLGDAYLRIGDGYFILKENQLAIDFYDKAIAVDAIDTDYAIFQEAVCYGLQGKHSSKVEALGQLLKNFARTRFQADAKYEIGETYFTFLDDNRSAEKYFQMVIDDHQKSSFYVPSLLKIGLIKFNNGDEDGAFALFDKVITEHPGSREAKEALLKIEKIFIQQGKVADYENYLTTHKLTTVTKDQLDKANYEQAEVKYLNGKYKEAYDDFQKYLDKYPDGGFVLSANFYRSEAAYFQKMFDEALKGYNYVIGRPKNTFTEKSLLRSAEIHYNNKNYTESRLMWTILEEVAEVQENLYKSRVGLMRTSFALDKHDQAIEYAQKLLSMEKIATEVEAEAHLTIAKSALAQDKIGLALPEFVATEKLMKNAIGAEAKFNIALIQHMQGNYDECQKHIFELVDKYASYKDWVSKSFLLLSDNYLKLNDAYQAKITLQYVIDKSGSDEYRNIAQKKLTEILAAEVEQEMQNSEPEEVEIKIERTPGTDNEGDQ